jgi:uncharacterized tellurite resistance protein B-like protein
MIDRPAFPQALPFKSSPTKLSEGSGSFFDPVPPVFVFLSNLAAGDTAPSAFHLRWLRSPPLPNCRTTKDLRQWIKKTPRPLNYLKRQNIGELRMLDIVKRFFSKKTTDTTQDANRNTEHDVRVAACALFLEMARIDETFTEAEMDTILSIMKEKYGLSQEHADALIAEADKELAESVDLWQFARRINDNYSTDEKIEIIETLWRMVYIDGKMDAYEHYLMSKLKNLLRLSHNQLIDAKLRVLHSD